MEVHKWLNYGLTGVVEADIEGFFDHIMHARLLSSVEERIADGYILELIREWLKAGVVCKINGGCPDMGQPHPSFVKTEFTF